MIIGTLENGTTCVYDLPDEIKTAEQFQSLIYGYNNGRMAESQREELFNQPKLLGLNGPMWNLQCIRNGCTATTTILERK